MGEEIREYESVKVNIKDIKLDSQNPNEFTPEMSKRLKESMLEFGNTQDIVVDKKTMVLADGEHRLQQYVKAGIKDIPVKLVPFRNDAHRRAYRQAANKIRGMHLPDLDAAEYLKIIEGEEKDLLKMATGMSMTEVEKHLRHYELMNKTEDFDAEEEAKKIINPTSKTGQVFKLGNHRLMCGDSTNAQDVAMLMQEDKADMVLTDPPYNTGMSSKKACESTRLTHMFNDDMSERDWHKFLENAINSINHILKSDSVAYICMGWKNNWQLIPHIKEHFELSNTIIWDKIVHGLGSDYKYTYEFINVCKKGKRKLNTHHEEEYKDLWHMQRKVGRNDDHATAKPVELMEIPLRHASEEGNIVGDLFGGSGSTLIACEKIGRHCRMMEINPVYCDVIIRRWEEFTGQKMEKVQ